MMKFALLIVAIAIGSAVASLKEYNHESVVAISGNSSHFRAYNATWFPDQDPRAIIVEGIEYDVTSPNSAQLDAVVFFLDDFNQTTLFFEYYEAQAVADNKGNLTSLTEAAFAFAVRCFVVFEYVEGNGIAGFQNGTADNITGIYDLSHLDLPWKPMEINETTVTGADGHKYKVWWVTIQTLDEVFLMRFIVAGTPIQVSGVDLTPDSMKIDYQINWFTDLHVPADWTTGPSDPELFPTASPGFVMVAAAGAETFSANVNGTGNNNGNGDASFEFTSAGYTGFFSWETSADVTINGYESAKAVMADQVDAGSNQSGGEGFAAEWIIRFIFFSFEGSRPESVAWDPELGSKIAYKDDGSSNVSGANMLVLNAILLLLVIVNFVF